MPATNKSLQLFLFSKRTIVGCQQEYAVIGDRKSTRLNSSPRLHLVCRLLLEKKKTVPEKCLLSGAACGITSARLASASGRPTASAPEALAAAKDNICVWPCWTVPPRQLARS